jgi:hypothetical protein
MHFQDPDLPESEQSEPGRQNLASAATHGERTTSLRTSRNTPCANVHKIASAHLSDVRNKFSDLNKLESVLAETVAQCSDALPPNARCSIFWMLAGKVT